jgi:hypothetical protein
MNAQQNNQDSKDAAERFDATDDAHACGASRK